jgi:predicted double-glycine peptidase
MPRYEITVREISESEDYRSNSVKLYEQQTSELDLPRIVAVINNLPIPEPKSKNNA